MMILELRWFFNGWQTLTNANNLRKCVQGFERRVSHLRLIYLKATLSHIGRLKVNVKSAINKLINLPMY